MVAAALCLVGALALAIRGSRTRPRTETGRLTWRDTTIRERYLKLYSGAIADMLDKRGYRDQVLPQVHYAVHTRQPRRRTGVHRARLSLRQHGQRRYRDPAPHARQHHPRHGIGLGVRRGRGLRALGRDHVHGGARAWLHRRRSRRRRSRPGLHRRDELSRLRPVQVPGEFDWPLGHHGIPGPDSDRRDGDPSRRFRFRRYRWCGDRAAANSRWKSWSRRKTSTSGKRVCARS